MADYLTLDGAVIDVVVPDGGEKEPERTGDLSYGFDNTLSTSEDATEEKRTWRFMTPSYAYADMLALLAILNTTADQVAAGGWSITRALPPDPLLDPPVTVDVLPQLGEIVHDPTSATDFGYMIAFTLHEI